MKYGIAVLMVLIAAMAWTIVSVGARADEGEDNPDYGIASAFREQEAEQAQIREEQRQYWQTETTRQTAEQEQFWMQQQLLRQQVQQDQSLQEGKSK